MYWTFILIILPFLCINLVFEMMSFRSHAMYSLVSITLIIVGLLYSIAKKMYFLKVEYVKTLDLYNSILYCYMVLASRALYILIFVFDSNMLINMSMILILIIQTTILFSQINYKTKLPKLRVFSKTAGIFGNTVMLLITMLIAVGKVILFKFLSNLYSINERNHSRWC